ncbi:uncharacterized protein [Pyxicephalus adspersus]|uniref:uncharacterized protein isoform X2 n=1 Tax=Pyxicephalus adspersus TaxID=30357 RepID=UPI003B5D0451
MKNILKMWTKSKNKHISPNEKVHLLPKTEQQEPKHTTLKKVIKGINNTVHSICKPKRKLQLNSDTNPEKWKSTDKMFKDLMANHQYYEVCVLICKLEDDEGGDGEELYQTLSQEMWKVVGKALAGDQRQNVRLQAIPQCIKWAKQTQSQKDPDWGPQEWSKKLEDLFDADIKETIPKFAPGTKDKNLEKYLKDLKCQISNIISKGQRFPEELTFTYLKCLHLCLLNELTSLAEQKLSYEEQVLLYKWTHDQHGELCKYLQGSGNFDHMLFEEWFFNNGNKIKSTGQELIQKALREILQQEIVWNSYPNTDIKCYFSNIQKELTVICEAVRDMSTTLVTNLNSIFWEDFLNFLTRYEDFLKNKIDKAEGMISGKGVEMGLRIVNNSHILRNTLLSIGNIQQESEIQRLVDQCENKGINIILSILGPEIKKFNTIIQHRITVLYIQSFFKNKSQNRVELFVQGSRKLKEFFAELVSVK